MHKRVLLKSIGCRTNQEEMSVLQGQLVQQGHIIVQTAREADIVVLNTCSVTSGTEATVVRSMHALKRESPAIRICVTGCMAQHMPQKLKQNAHWVVGNQEKHTIPDLLNNENGGIFSTPFNSIVQAPVVPAIAASIDLSVRTRWSIKIQEGCNNRCTYCIVPLLRGPSRSAVLTDIKGSFYAAITAGFKEIVITGTHIGQFTDGHGTDLLGLLQSLTAVPGDFRVRLSSLDPRDCSVELVDFLTTHPKMCRHVHVSVQSFSPDILRAMDRPEKDIDTFADRLKKLRTNHPFCGIGGDFIVGFPGESAGHFEQTCAMVKEIGFSYGHVFRFSPRPNTLAATLPAQVSETEKSHRSKVLHNVLQQQHTQFIDRNRSIEQRIVVETNGVAVGLTSNYLRVSVATTHAVRNSWLAVQICGSDKKGTIVAEQSGVVCRQG